MSMSQEDLGTIYLIHLDEPLGKPDPNREARGRLPRVREYKPHAQHYLGWTTDLERRVGEHESGYRNGNNGSSYFMLAVKNAGISWRVVKTWENEPLSREFQMKKNGHFKRICPVCREEEMEKIREWRRNRKEKEEKGKQKEGREREVERKL